MRQVDIYLDTSIRGPRRANGGYMYILAYKTTKGTADCGNYKRLEDTTQNQLNLKALEEALGRLNGPCELTIWTDCKYIASALNSKWYEAWGANDWKTAKGQNVSDAETWIKVIDLLAIHSFKLRYNESHEYKAWMKKEIERKVKENV